MHVLEKEAAEVVGALSKAEPEVVPVQARARALACLAIELVVAALLAREVMVAVVAEGRPVAGMGLVGKGTAVAQVAALAGLPTFSVD